MNSPVKKQVRKMKTEVPGTLDKNGTGTGKIAIFGGTFDPIHNGHLAVAKAAYRQLHVDEVIFMPTKLRYYKKDKAGSEVYDRVAMLSLAIADYDYMRFSDMELRARPSQNYTYLTLERLKKRYPDSELIFILGGDSLEYLSSWREPEKLLHLATFAAAVRDDVDTERAKELIGKYETDFPGSRFRLLRMKPCDISSTTIRNHAAEGKPVSGMVPDAVERYIQRNRLYTKSRGLV